MRLIKKLWDFKHLLSICLVYTVLITVAFLYPLKGTTSINFILPNDKLIHFLIYLSLSFLWISYSSRVANYKKTMTTIIMVMLLCFFYGIIIEIVQQLFIETRMADFLDIIANSVGTLLGVLIFLKFKFRFNS